MKQLKNMTEVELRDLMDAVCWAIQETVWGQDVEKPHFVVVLFNDPRVAQYAANCQRSDIIKALRETADRLEAQQDVVRDMKEGH